MVDANDPHHLGAGALATITDSGKYPLEPWELGFCRFLAAHPRARFKEQIAVASGLAGTDINMVSIRQLRARKNFRKVYADLKARILHRLDAHRETFETENVGKAIAAHSKALDWAVEKQDYRAIPALMEPAVKAMYKQVDEIQQKPMIVLNLGGFAQAHLDDPIETVEYEELEPEKHDPTT